MKINREYTLDLAVPADRAIKDAFDSAIALIKDVTEGLPRHASLGAWLGLLNRTATFTDECLDALAAVSKALRTAAAGEQATSRIKAADALDRALMLVTVASTKIAA